LDPSNEASVVVAAVDTHHAGSDIRVAERLATWSTAPADLGWEEAFERVASARRKGFDRLLAEHREAWAERWADAEVTIEGHADDQLMARLAVFHLLAAAPDFGDAAVGARGLSGPAYGGHVFWDADVFVLPALAAIRPRAARAMLEYRVRRLPAARAAATALGRRGARFPWESAADGSDVTPHGVLDGRGRLTPIRTGQYEEHIVADVAWAAFQYVAWTADATFLSGEGRDLVLDTARYWASRARHDADGRAHIDGVMGPDEYHEIVNDNAFTNGMARWNLRAGAALLESGGGDSGEAATWIRLADTIVDGFDAELGIYEQFDGYWDLEPLAVADVAEAPVAIDMLLGHDRVAGSQLIKQADVLMLHHLLPDDMRPNSLRPDVSFYEPRTAHGSSLSPPIHASLLARCRQPDRALVFFRLAARLDLEDVTGTTAGGVHLATMGGVWQALAYGFLGLRPRGEVLDIDPCLPRAWKALALRFRFHGQPITIRAEPGSVTVTCEVPLHLRVQGADVQHCEPPGTTVKIEGRGT
jgi:trehalose/maltose hydrolase-like predicted phosphorylase